MNQKTFFYIMVAWCLLGVACHEQYMPDNEDIVTKYFRINHLYGDIKFIQDSTWLISKDTGAKKWYHYAKEDYQFAPKAKQDTKSSSLTENDTSTTSMGYSGYHDNSGTAINCNDTTGFEAYFDREGVFDMEQLREKDERNGLKGGHEQSDRNGILYDFVHQWHSGEYVRYVRQYDIHDNLILVEQHNSDTTLINKYVFTYDDSSLVTQCDIYNGVNKLICKIGYHYDSRYQTGYTLYDLEKKQTKEYRFEYADIDKHNNWHTRVIYINHQPLSQTARSIEYY